MSEKPQLCIALPTLVVASGTASGLGTRIAQQLIESGVITIGVDVAPEPDSLKSRLYLHVQGDVTQDRLWATVEAEIKKAAPASIGLVTSAAMLEVGTILEFDRAALERTMSVNFVGTALAIRATLPHMIERGGGTIVAVASVNGTIAEQQLSVYNASKGAVRQLARTGRDGSCPARDPRQCSQSRRHARGALRAPHEIGERSGEIPGHASRASPMGESRGRRRRESGLVPAVGCIRRIERMRSDRRRRTHDEFRFSHRQRRGVGLTRERSL